MHQDTLPPKKGLLHATWRMVLALAMMNLATALHAGDVTVIGSLWKSTPPSPYDEADIRLPPVVYPDTPPVTEKPPLLLFKNPPIESTVYLRADYYRWSMPKTLDFNSMHTGTLSTIGYERRIGAEQFRGEMFGGNMETNEIKNYTYDSRYYSEQTSGVVGYYGGRAEIEHLWNIGMEDFPPITLFAGIGSRFWQENYFDQYTITGYHVDDWQRAWWTIYPYCGFRKEWELVNKTTIFATGRVGTTLLNYSHSNEVDIPAAYPKPGITAQAEIGWRDQWLSISAYFETMGWQNSKPFHIHNDPDTSSYVWKSSQYYTTGIKLGITY